MISQHLEALKRSTNYSKTTIYTAQAWLTRFQVFCGDRHPTELRVKDLEQWHKQLAWTPGPTGKLYSPNTVNQAVGAVRRLYQWLLAEGELKVDPTSTLLTPRVKKTRSQKLDLAPSEIRKLLFSPDLESPTGIRDRAILGVLLETKVSRSTCSLIDQDHLCFDTGALLTKGRTRQIHSLSDGLLADLHRYLREGRPLLISGASSALFLNLKGKRHSGPSIQQMIRYHCRLCGL
jgi:integrase/recombinase XerD